MSIYKKQNEVGNLELLAAYSQVYLQAKRYMGIRTIFSVLVAMSGTLIGLLAPASAPMVGAVSAVWSLISEVVLKSWEKQKVGDGAKIQEEFDTNVFELPWNSNLVGNKLTPELIRSAERDYRGDRSRLRNWYPDTGQAQRPKDVLICQRSCVVWDWRLRQLFIMMVAGASLAWLAIEVIMAFMLDLSFSRFFLALFVPSLSLLLIGFNISKDNWELLNLRQKLDKDISQAFSSGRRNAVNIRKCREIQDDLFRLRSKVALIPNWFNALFRDRFEKDMQEVARTIGKND